MLEHSTTPHVLCHTYANTLHHWHYGTISALQYKHATAIIALLLNNLVRTEEKEGWKEGTLSLSQAMRSRILFTNKSKTEMLKKNYRFWNISPVCTESKLDAWIVNSIKSNQIRQSLYDVVNKTVSSYFAAEWKIPMMEQCECMRERVFFFFFAIIFLLSMFIAIAVGTKRINYVRIEHIKNERGTIKLYST